MDQIFWVNANMQIMVAIVCWKAPKSEVARFNPNVHRKSIRNSNFNYSSTSGACRDVIASSTVHKHIDRSRGKDT
jgi:hypothetical protein